MVSDLFRVKRAGMVRIVNPVSFTPGDRTYRYGDILMIRPGGVIRVLLARPRNSLASYQAPHPPITPMDCPSDALLFKTLHELKLIADGLDAYREPFDPPLPGLGLSPESSTKPLPIRVKQSSRVPLSRMAKVMPPPVETSEEVGGPYRPESSVETTQGPCKRRFLRPSGILTAMEVRGSLVKVWYAPNLLRLDQQCEHGSWFWMHGAEFLRMDVRSRDLALLEKLERLNVDLALRSL